MWPLLKNGDSIAISEVTSVQKGDIITVQNMYNRILTHRVIYEKDLVTKGDNNVMKVYSFIKKIVPVNNIIYFIKQITYPVFIFILKISYGRDY